jgi:hypothetical protein
METLIISISNKAQAAEIKKALELFKGVQGVYSAEEAENKSMIAGIESGLKTKEVSRDAIFKALK